MKIPTHEEIWSKQESGTELTAIETFICDFEPARLDQAKDFREKLSNALSEAKNL